MKRKTPRKTFRKQQNHAKLHAKVVLSVEDKMTKLAPTLTLMSALLCALPFQGRSQDITQLALVQTSPIITVTGTATVSVPPDMATIRMGLRNTAGTAAAALTRNSQDMTALLQSLAAMGIAPRDIQTQGLSLNPDIKYDSTGRKPPQIEGYTAENGVELRVRDLNQLGNILDQVVQNGATTLNGLSFGLIDPAPKRDEARRSAVADAQHRATLYAAAAGVQLGGVRKISDIESGQNPRPMMAMRAMAPGADSVPIAEGEISLSASVMMEFDLLN